MDDQEAKTLLITIAKTIARDDQGYFSLRELAAHINENQHFYQRLHIENIQRFAYYRRAHFLSCITTILTLGIFLLLYKRPIPPSRITAESGEVVRRPEVLLPEAVYTKRLTTGQMMRSVDALVADTLLTVRGEYHGAVYYPTSKLWEVSI